MDGAAHFVSGVIGRPSPWTRRDGAVTSHAMR